MLAPGMLAAGGLRALPRHRREARVSPLTSGSQSTPRARAATIDVMAEAEPKAKWQVVPLAQASRLPWPVYGMTGYEAVSGASDISIEVPAASVSEIEAALGRVGSEGSLVSLERVQESALFGLARAGTYQLPSYALSRFNGVPLPPGAQLRFADINRWFSGQLESRLFTITRRGTSKYYAWDYHAPVGHHPHPLYHVNQSGMHGTFGHSNHAAIPAHYQVAARNLRILKLGGRVFLVTGALVDGALLVRSGVTAAREGTPAPVVAQAVRTVGSWGMAWAGAKLGFAAGALAGVETGPGLALTAIGGGIIGGALGFFGADCIADLVYED